MRNYVLASIHVIGITTEKNAADVTFQYVSHNGTGNYYVVKNG